MQMTENESPALSLPERVHADILDWCKGRSWGLRVPLWLFMGYVGLNQFWDPKYAFESLFAGINLGIHEGGHLLFRGCGEFIGVSGGTFLQLAAPTGSMFMFLKQRDYFAIAVCFGWLSTNLMATAVYMADAELMNLPLVTVGGGGGEVIHDWRYLFSHLGLLSGCTQIGWMTRQAANICMLVCMVGGALLMWTMHQSSVSQTRRKPG